MKIQKKTLSNGLRALFIELPDSKTVTVEVLVRTGSLDEKEHNQGISHFLEHMCFKGTTNRPTAMDISRELESLGAHSNAYTSHNHTAYYAKSASVHAGKLLDVIADIYLHSTFPEFEIQKEKGVIVEEINMYKDQPDSLVDEEWNKIFFKTGSMSRPIIGTKESVLRMTRKDFVEYHKKYYVPENTVVVVSGSFDQKKMFEDIKKYFSKIPQNPVSKRTKIQVPRALHNVSVVQKKTDQAHIVLGVKACDMYSDEKYATAVLSCILGGGMSSRLFQKLREELGVAYYVYSQFSQGQDFGTLKISAGIDTTRVKEVLSVINDEVAKISKEGVGDEEMYRAKEFMIGSMYLGLESSDEYCAYFGVKEIFGLKSELPKEREARIRKVSKDEVKKVARKLFAQSFTTALIGDFPKDFLGK